MQSRYQLYFVFFLIASFTFAQSDKPSFSYLDVFEMEYASDPKISPSGNKVVYRRVGYDIMKDHSAGNLWIINSDGSKHQKLTSRELNEHSAIWSPNGDRIAFISSTDEGSELYVYWLNSGKLARLSQLNGSPSSLSWSPDGKQLAFSMKIESAPPVLVKMPAKPKGAKWADAPRITDRLYHEADGSGYITPGFNHLFVIPAQGGSARKITSGNFNHRGNLSWHPNGSLIYFSGNRNENWEYDFRNSEIYSVHLNSGEITPLTSRIGPDTSPSISPNGRLIAYVGYDDKVQAHQTRRLYLMKSDGSNQRVLTTALDRNIENLQWEARGNGLYFSYDDKGNTKIGYISLDGKLFFKLADNMGGTTLGRPYASGSFSVSNKGTLAYTHTRPNYPAEIAIQSAKSTRPRLITDLNSDILNFRNLGKVEEVWYKSSFDGRDIQAWVVKPPNFNPENKYPLLVENHGGPILNYGDRFSIEMQLYAAAGYVVFYPNPRGSTSYGEEFANLLYNNYPGEDYNDVMDGVDYLIEKGLAHEDQLYVTGGSAGGIMTAWMIGKNNRFEAAVVVKPVMNWISKTLVADNYFGYANSRYPGQPWENFETYWKFSPISLVGNVETPTMVMVGMDDLRTPPSEAKQLYHALKLRKIETVLVEIPGASHGIASKPSNLITKVANTLAWLEKYRN
jgi:dipeptidyl aminopeptidase/acylaminoacyl peptidase